MYRDSNENPSQLECGDERHSGRSRKRVSALRSPITSSRVLCSKAQEKPKSSETTNASAAENSNKRKEKKNEEKKAEETDHCK
ncbi:unnamed protein product [Cuscuta campestris]|uniref:Uncharacterized protein n=1 Tax=Cuscuta campestris TaxID=132261 RepID=A0A484KKS9_9ASTE|nr:unnamed protein product [Cuscuta campestris]